MSIPSRYSVAIHILTLLEMEGDLSSEEIAGSVGTNPSIIRLLLGKLKKAKLIDVRRGVKGSALAKPADEISLLEVYKATELDDSLFLLHEYANPNCPIGRNIQNTLEGILDEAQLALENKLGEYKLSDVKKGIQFHLNRERKQTRKGA
ncbi:Rrf2 family transcriptional regulator [Leptospira idonii]|uniref:Rrf2 family transcriptional regulator n=1 Tax=Leptospira idonii TaxID=1193500 RepID=A0A4R9M600_9LEPT|nr:Rrf2 family transcriptional regulator [Leptospira idonii]TGN20619.1 Rrf2 family transcriptional regulator [Leptospira idonii]